MVKKISLYEIGMFYKGMIRDSIAWITMDITGIRVFAITLKNKKDKSIDTRPYYDTKSHIWKCNSDCKLIMLITGLSLKYINIRGFKTHGDLDFSKCIDCVDQDIIDQVKGKKNTEKAHNRKKVIAFMADGSTILFESKQETKEFFGLKRVEQVGYYIKTGYPLPDGTTTIDEALE